MSERATKEQQEVRNALTKKSLTSEENRRIMDYLSADTGIMLASRCAKRYEAESVWLAGAIRMFTGMRPREVCALTRRDMVQLPGVGCYQFIVSKFTGSNGVILRHTQFEDRQKFRRVPIAPTLASMLLNRRQYIMSVYGLNDKDLKELLIILPRSREKQLKQGVEIDHCSPDVINRACRVLTDKAGIPQQLLLLPGENKNMTTDIFKYQGDIFQSNFRYWANHACGLTRGELSYVLGNTPPDTFSRHYCDYTNDLIQYGIANKLERWAGAVMNKADAPPRSKTGFVISGMTETVEPDNGGAAYMDMIFEVHKDGGTLTIEPDQWFGHSGNYTFYGKEESK